MNITFSQPIKNILSFPQSRTSFRGKSCADEFTSEFDKRRDSVVNNLSNQKVIDRAGLNRLRDCSSEELFEGLLFGYVEKLTEKLEYSHIDNSEDILIDIINRKGKSKLSEEQFFRKSGINAYDKLFGLYKAVVKPDENKEIEVIKDILKNKYNVDEMYFNNDVSVAQNWLETARLVSQFGLEMPKQIMTCPYVFAAGTNGITSKGSMVVINPDKACYSGVESTKSPLHAYVHETVHCNQPSLISFNLKNVPEHLKNTADNISEYARNNFMHEIHAELKTKQILATLSPDEEELLNYIEC